MVTAKKGKFRELTGDFAATVSDVLVEENQWYNEEFANSCTHNLSIAFVLEDPDTGADIEFTQKFVSPLLGGKYLFQQLLDAAGIDTSGDDEEEVDEQSLVGKRMIVTFGKRKAKDGREFDTIVGARGENEAGVSSENVGDVFGE